jgi:hypothetical protein
MCRGRAPRGNRFISAFQQNDSDSAGLGDRDHLAVDGGVVDVEHGRHLVAERVTAAQDIAIARDEAAAALLEVAEASKAVILDVEQPVGKGSSRCPRFINI